MARGKEQKAKVVEMTAAPAAAPVAVEAAAETEERAHACPTYTLRADRRFDILALVAVLRLSREWGARPETVADLERAVREFELYEERHR